MAMYTNYLVCYDIEDNKVRKKFYEKLKDLGLVPIQKSVFMGYLKPPEFVAVQDIAKNLLNEGTDSCLWFACSLSEDQVRSCLGLKNFTLEDPDGAVTL